MATNTKARSSRPTKAEPPLKKIADKEPTALHEEFSAWLVDQTGYKDVDLKSVQLATVLRMEFQRSPQNQERLAASKEARAAEAEERAKNKAEREAKRAQREKDKAEKAKAPAAKKTATAKKAAAPAKKAAPARRRPAKKAASSENFD